MIKWSIRRKGVQEEERFILAIDGGGVRGIVPAVILSKLSRLLKENGDEKPLYSHFDLIAGTSTGGLLSLALSADDSELEKEKGEEKPVYQKQKKGFFRKEDILQGYIQQAADPATLKQLYLDHARDIFKEKSVRLFGSVFTDKYSTSNLENFLTRTFKDLKLKDALVPTTVISYDTISGKAVPLSSFGTFKDMLMIDAARATSAAPLYFAPKYTLSPEGEKMALIDGGVIANNPALLAYIEARKLYPEAKHFHIISLSTASPVYSFDPSSSMGGVSGWAEPISRIYPNAQADLIDTTMKALPDVSYLRVYAKISEEKIKLDDTRVESLALLEAGAENIYIQQEAEIKEYAKLLANRTSFDNVRLKSDIPLLTEPLDDSSCD